MRRGTRQLLALALAVLLVGGLTWVLTTVLSGRSRLPFSASCTATANGMSFDLDPDQASIAATIAAVGRKRGMPNHAVTIAIATARQESKLRNLASGDRDSIGVFQQRPSQGWGTPAQLRDPRYQAGEFFTKLAEIPHWQTLPITVAAQEVQRSGVPDAYAQWEGLGRTYAIALTGEKPAALTCDLGSTDDRGGESLDAALQAELGISSLSAPVSPTVGWARASWLVAKAENYGVESVSFGGKKWTRSSGAWKADSSAGSSIRITMLQSSS